MVSNSPNFVNCLKPGSIGIEGTGAEILRRDAFRSTLGRRGFVRKQTVSNFYFQLLGVSKKKLRTLLQLTKSLLSWVFLKIALRPLAIIVPPTPSAERRTGPTETER